MVTNTAYTNEIELIKKAIERADRFESKLSNEVKQVPFLGSLKNRALLNNLGELAIRYLEIGCHKGGSYCSSVFDNDNIISTTVIDSFESDHMNGEVAQIEFMENMNRFKPSTTRFKLIKSDCFNIELKEAFQPNDFYLFDGPHAESDQCKALTYYLPILSDTFIYCCDDYGWDDVKNGTQRGIKEAGLEILFEKELISDKEYDNESWWTGFYVALLKKKK